MAITFGKRNPETTLKSFQEKAAALARQVGLEVGGPDGVFPSDSDLKELMARERARLERRTEQVNKALAPLIGPQCEMLHYCLVPESCWLGETGMYLLNCLRLTPYSDWNTAFLPGNAFTAEMTGMPLHLRAEVPAFTAHAKEYIKRCILVSKVATDNVTRTGNLDFIMKDKEQSVAAIHNFGTYVRSLMESRINRTTDRLQTICLDVLSRTAQSSD